MPSFPYHDLINDLVVRDGQDRLRVSPRATTTFYGGAPIAPSRIPSRRRRKANSRKPIVEVNLLPPRLTTRETLDLARVSAATLKKRQDEGRFPKPIERNIYLRDDVLPALGLASAPVTDDEAFQDAANAFHQDRITRKR